MMPRMRTAAPPELAVMAFLEEHRRCGDLDGGVDGERLWMQCASGAQMAHPAGDKGCMGGRPD